MTLPVQQFPILNFQQANPMLAGMQAGSDMLGSIVSNAMQMQQLKYLPQQRQMQMLLNQSTIDKNNAQTGMYGAHGSLFDQQAQLAAPLAQSLVGLRAAQQANNYSQVPLHHAQTQYTNTQNEYYPESLQLRNIALSNAANRTQVMDNNSVIGANNLSNQADLFLANANRQRTQNGLPALSMQEAQNQGIIQSGQTAAAGKVFKATNSADTTKRIPAGGRFDTSYQTAKYYMDNGADQYFGPKGQAQLLKDNLQAITTGQTPPSLLAWRNLNSAIENMNVQGALLEGVPADQISRGQYKKIFDINRLSHDPKTAKAMLDNAYRLGKSATNINTTPLGSFLPPGAAESIAEKATALPQSTQPNVAQQPRIATPSQTDLEHTAKLHNMTVAQVKQKLGIK